MARLILIIALVFSGIVHADDCEQVAKYMLDYEKKLQVKYMQTHLPPQQWAGFIKASDQVLNDLYLQRMEICRDEKQN